jgi:hypothetical protein
MASPEWNQTANGSDSFGSDGRLVTPHDSTNLDPVAKGVCVSSIAGGATLSIVTLKGTTINFVDVPTGFIPPYRVKRVNATGTTATVYTID